MVQSSTAAAAAEKELPAHARRPRKVCVPILAFTLAYDSMAAACTFRAVKEAQGLKRYAISSVLKADCKSWHLLKSI